MTIWGQSSGRGQSRCQGAGWGQAGHSGKPAPPLHGAEEGTRGGAHSDRGKEHAVVITDGTSVSVKLPPKFGGLKQRLSLSHNVEVGIPAAPCRQFLCVPPSGALWGGWSGPPRRASAFSPLSGSPTPGLRERLALLTGLRRGSQGTRTAT